MNPTIEFKINDTTESNICSAEESKASAVQCMEGFRDKMEMLMRAGDILDYCKRGRSTVEDAQAARERSLEIWKKGSTIVEAARQGGAYAQSFRAWLIKEGHHTPKSK